MPEETFTPQSNPLPTNQEKPAGSGISGNIFGIVVAGLIILIISVSVWFVIQLPSLTSAPEGQDVTVFSGQKAPKVNDVSDLEKLEKEVKNTNIDDLSIDLDKNDTDAAEF